MDASLYATDASVRPWRTTALLASGFAALELVALVVVGAILIGKPLRQHVQQQAVRREVAALTLPKPKVVPEGKPKLTRAETSVLVLNGNGQAGAASDKAAQVRAQGYIVGGVGNAAKQTAGPTVVMYRPGYRPEGLRLAHLAVIIGSS